MERFGQHIIHLEVGEPDFDTFESIKESIIISDDKITRLMRINT